MKTLISKKTKLSKYMLRNNDTVEMYDTYIRTVEKGVENYYVDLNVNNGALRENVTPPNDWERDKYRYENATWVLSNKLEELTFAEAIPQIRKDLRALRATLADIISDATAFNNPMPAGLTTQIESAKTLCRTIKTDIAALTEANYATYTVMSPATLAIIQ